MDTLNTALCFLPSKSGVQIQGARYIRTAYIAERISLHR